MNNHSKSELPVNRNSPLFRKIVEICGEPPPLNHIDVYIPFPIAEKFVISWDARKGRALALLIGRWMSEGMILEVDELRHRSLKALNELHDSELIKYSRDLNICTINEDQVLSLLNRLFPEQRKP